MQADLHNFQIRHFSVCAGADGACLTDQQIYARTTQPREILEHGSDELASDELGADDLGFYLDGVRRTLTDDQISMFRHSEIYSLLRKRQLQKEDREMDVGLSTSPPYNGSPFAGLGQTIREAGDTQLGIHPSNRTAKGDKSIQKKRKHNPDGDHTWYSATSRRHIRQLDDAVPDVGFLDYGEEAGSGLSGQHTTLVGTSPRAQIDYADHTSHDTDPGRDALKSPRQGRKIWWPSIGQHMTAQKNRKKN
ncbi:MAG: hypothetical protein LQ343_006403 [Gyalolechia ehrenbergii]|nr:MAG: hypothetical protein LQ343_006403 [Gyalolechia ehrenbergii]